jgi:hypothetical protein
MVDPACTLGVALRAALSSLWRPALLGKNSHTAERPAACDLIRANKSTALFPRIESQAAGRCMCVFTLRHNMRPIVHVFPVWSHERPSHRRTLGISFPQGKIRCASQKCYFSSSPPPPPSHPTIARKSEIA